MYQKYFGWHGFKPGMLIVEKVWTADKMLAFKGENIGVVLRCYDSNVYEGASVDVLIDGAQRNLRIDDILRVEDLVDPDVEGLRAYEKI